MAYRSVYRVLLANTVMEHGIQRASSAQSVASAQAALNLFCVMALASLVASVSGASTPRYVRICARLVGTAPRGLQICKLEFLALRVAMA